MEDIEPLHPESWFRAVRELAKRQQMTAPGELESLLRHAYHLLQLAPRPLRRWIRPTCAERSYESFLECEAFESAAIALAGGSMTYWVTSLGPEGFEAEVRCADDPGPSIKRSECMASSLLGAWLHCILALEKRAVREMTESPHLFPHTAQSGPHPKPIEH